ncbi:DUF2384 domain-containing protein [Xylophilus rhododendri]|uniref:DUF2384 domain-containing protein n=1 Tax=Xylophilus rhododendri TaxID=2697032 RepID=A0A857J3R5_9BURK|nr:antitoxin Xre/MbcA/ParS toxin-binding domain-containing protein [Xylophilus rhododendri]QHI97883.1 DUF2384 domain-containing protein [Xylophilus rhododendri]
MNVNEMVFQSPEASDFRASIDDRPPEISAELKKRYSALIASSGPHLVIALEMLGGRDVFSHIPESLLDVHRWVSHGMPSASILHLAQAMEPLSSNALSEALGISLRTLHRKKGAQGDTLSVAQGGRTFKFAEVVAKASVVLGNRETAVQWLTSPAMGLDRQKPIDLLATPMGTQLVEELLGRIEYGVYA